ncbi:MAG: TIGR03546 family protein [Elusimicrobiaceae bacterium]|nr:TIGR03546 family protein [Elusimicrobiaceae bacterium]
MTPLGILRKLVQGLTQNSSPSEVALGAAFGVVIGMVPKANLTAQLLLVLLMLLRTNAAVGLAVAAAVSALGAVYDPLANIVGYALLVKATALAGFWTALYNAPFVPWTAFNNTIVLGNLVLGIMVFVPAYLSARRAAVYYHEKLAEKVRQSRLVRYLRRSWAVDWYFRTGN